MQLTHVALKLKMYLLSDIYLILMMLIKKIFLKELIKTSNAMTKSHLKLNKINARSTGLLDILQLNCTNKYSTALSQASTLLACTVGSRCTSQSRLP
jgi:hypothetical protein